jgi:hypothetical protein
LGLHDPAELVHLEPVNAELELGGRLAVDLEVRNPQRVDGLDDARIQLRWRDVLELAIGQHTPPANIGVIVHQDDTSSAFSTEARFWLFSPNPKR